MKKIKEKVNNAPKLFSSMGGGETGEATGESVYGVYMGQLTIVLPNSLPDRVFGLAIKRTASSIDLSDLKL